MFSEDSRLHAIIIQHIAFTLSHVTVVLTQETVIVKQCSNIASSYFSMLPL